MEKSFEDTSVWLMVTYKDFDLVLSEIKYFCHWQYILADILIFSDTAGSGELMIYRKYLRNFLDNKSCICSNNKNGRHGQSCCVSFRKWNIFMVIWLEQIEAEKRFRERFCNLFKFKHVLKMNCFLTGVTSWAGIAYPSGAPELNLVFVGFVLFQL